MDNTTKVKTFGVYLTQVRENSGYSQGKLAKRLGVATSSVSRWETGQTYPDRVQLINLLSVFPDRKDKLVSLWLTN